MRLEQGFVSYIEILKAHDINECYLVIDENGEMAFITLGHDFFAHHVLKGEVVKKAFVFNPLHLSSNAIKKAIGENGQEVFLDENCLSINNNISIPLKKIEVNVDISERVKEVHKALSFNKVVFYNNFLSSLRTIKIFLPKDENYRGIYGAYFKGTSAEYASECKVYASDGKRAISIELEMSNMTYEDFSFAIDHKLLQTLIGQKNERYYFLWDNGTRRKYFVFGHTMIGFMPYDYNTNILCLFEQPELLGGVKKISLNAKEFKKLIGIFPKSQDYSDIFAKIKVEIDKEEKRAHFSIWEENASIQAHMDIFDIHNINEKEEFFVMTNSLLKSLKTLNGDILTLEWQNDGSVLHIKNKNKHLIVVKHKK